MAIGRTVNNIRFQFCRTWHFAYGNVGGGGVPVSPHTLRLPGRAATADHIILSVCVCVRANNIIVIRFIGWYLLCAIAIDIYYISMAIANLAGPKTRIIFCDPQTNRVCRPFRIFFFATISHCSILRIYFLNVWILNTRRVIRKPNRTVRSLVVPFRHFSILSSIFEPRLRVFGSVRQWYLKFTRHAHTV